jgi:hypothetical protein
MKRFSSALFQQGVIRLHVGGWEGGGRGFLKEVDHPVLSIVSHSCKRYVVVILLPYTSGGR